MTETTHGILNPRAGAAHFTLDRRAPSPDLAPYVERFWSVRWDLRERAPFAQETLPHPCVNMVVGTHRPGIGLGTQRFVAELEGAGWVVGVKFRPGGFFPFFGRDIAELAGRERAIATVFGEDGRTMEADVHAADRDDARIERVERFLRERRPAADEKAELAARAVEIAQSEPSIARASELGERVGVAPRALERLFRRYVGVSPKWVIRRFRVQEACERVARGEKASFSALAQELGYFDQAHFIRDFKAQVGRTPAEYAAMCAGVG